MKTTLVLLMGIFFSFQIWSGTTVTKNFILDPAKALDQVYDIYVAPNVGTTIQFPEDWTGSVFCGNCLFPGQIFKDQLFKLELSDKTDQMAVSATQIPGINGAPPAAGYLTALTVTLRSGITITALLHIALPENAQARVIFQMPNKDTANSILGHEREQRETEFKNRVKDAAADKIMSLLSHGVKCREFSGAPYRDQGFVVRLKQICKASSAAWVTFEAQNRLKTNDLSFKQAVLHGGADIESEQFYFNKPTIGFDEIASGTAWIELSDGEKMPSSWTLSVFEEGGAERKINAKNITF